MDTWWNQHSQENFKKKTTKISLNWAQIEAILKGVSAIDLGGLAIRNREVACAFTKEYGFDVSNTSELERIKKTHREAVNYIDEVFLGKDQRELIPDEVRYPENVLDLLIFASTNLTKFDVRRLCSCAVLKVMHGIFHIDHDFKLKYFDDIRRQIFESLDSLFISEEDRHFLTLKSLKIPLYLYEKKRNKGRKSVLLKLLQKPKYVAADIYDHLGARMVFETKAECLFAIQILRKSHLISVTNVKPFRSRNNLIDLELAKQVFNRFRPVLERAERYPLSIFKKMDEEFEELFVKKTRSTNPHSSSEYRGIQVTARKMVCVPNLAYLEMQNLISSLSEQMEVPDHFQEAAEAEKEYSFYFDYEIQLMDKNSYLKSMHGEASHNAYKRRQKETARRRVLGPALIRYLERYGRE